MRTYNKDTQEKLYTYITKELRLRPYTKGWYKGDCVLCGKKDKLGIHIDDARANCFYCGNHKNPLNYLMLAEGFTTFKEVYQYLGLLENTPYLQPLTTRDRTYTPKPKLPPEFKLLMVGDSEMANLARGYIKRRGLNPWALTIKGVGYCDSGEYAGHIVFPFYQQGELVYFQARKYIHISGEKFKNPSSEDFGIGKSHILYNADCLQVYQKIRLVESIINAETLGNNAVSQGGKSISSYQLSLLVKSPVTHVHILLDPDAYDKAIRLGLTLSETKTVKVVKLPDGEDVNSLGKKATLKLEKATPYQRYEDLFKILLTL